MKKSNIDVSVFIDKALLNTCYGAIKNEDNYNYLHNYKYSNFYNSYNYYKRKTADRMRTQFVHVHPISELAVYTGEDSFFRYKILAMSKISSFDVAYFGFDHFNKTFEDSINGVVSDGWQDFAEKAKDIADGEILFCNRGVNFVMSKKGLSTIMLSMYEKVKVFDVSDGI